MTAGVRLRLVTNSRRLRIVMTQRQAFLSEPGQWRAYYDLYVNGRLLPHVTATGGAYIGPTGVVQGDLQALLDFDDLPEGEKQIELWLPSTAMVVISSIALDDGARWLPWPDERVRIVFHGSSITHGIEAGSPSATWPAVVARLNEAQAINLGWAGSCLISGLAARLVRDQAADLIVLELGINVHQDGLLKERTFLSSVHSMLSIIRERHPKTPVIVVSPIFCESAENIAQSGGLTLERMRELLRQVVEVWATSGDENISYLSGLELFSGDDKIDLPDGLHPNADGNMRMGGRFHKAAVLALNQARLNRQRQVP